VWPANHDACYRIAAQRLWLANDHHGTDGTEVFLELLRDPRESVGPQAALAIALVHRKHKPRWRPSSPTPPTKAAAG
jgi:hypothetical protein